MCKVRTQNKKLARPLNPKIYQAKRKGHNRNNYYDRGREQNINGSYRIDGFERLPYREKPQRFRRGNLGSGSIEWLGTTKDFIGLGVA